jgi:hypothetical protein
MNISRIFALGALVIAGAAAVTRAASARAVYNEDGDCWHNRSVDVFPPALGLTVHEDDKWKWAEGEKHRWREHEGKGYGKGGNLRTEQWCFML